ncbi:MurR/RpiR family transcriptional regulator [Bifidobacterium aquikefiri]|uniref:RpiR family transcriptional regulator n=1 Tax=Bifidobacterium aquikefiri TaxID=1653207 RepID=A0A261GAF9_9BIFI|nr:MurR/RpiR family transcriptional regulator [Bifidobacterium aquikefiri]OZG68417.1 RpiR family transcriptional regulator [Bifidobacterium aquikefiri]
MSIVERIQENYDSLTAAEQDAAMFILGHLSDALLLNSAELSKLSKVSQPTLSRLYRKIGFRNAAEFKRDIRRHHQPGSPEFLSQGETTRGLLVDHMNNDVAALQHTFSRLDNATMDRIAQSIMKARNVAVIGLRNNYPMALHLREQLMQSRARVQALPEPGQSLAEEIVDLNKEDVAILFGARRRTAVFHNLATTLAEQHVQLIIIGDSTVRRTALEADAQFIETDLHSHVLSSYTAVFSVLALIADYVATSAQQGENVDASRSRIDTINQRFDKLRELENYASRR